MDGYSPPHTNLEIFPLIKEIIARGIDSIRNHVLNQPRNNLSDCKFNRYSITSNSFLDFKLKRIGATGETNSSGSSTDPISHSVMNILAEVDFE